MPEHLTLFEQMGRNHKQALALHQDRPIRQTNFTTSIYFSPIPAYDIALRGNQPFQRHRLPVIDLDLRRRDRVPCLPDRRRPPCPERSAQRVVEG